MTPVSYFKGTACFIMDYLTFTFDLYSFSCNCFKLLCVAWAARALLFGKIPSDSLAVSIVWRRHTGTTRNSLLTEKKNRSSAHVSQTSCPKCDLRKPAVFPWSCSLRSHRELLDSPGALLGFFAMARCTPQKYFDCFYSCASISIVIMYTCVCSAISMWLGVVIIKMTITECCVWSILF